MREWYYLDKEIKKIFLFAVIFLCLAVQIEAAIHKQTDKQNRHRQEKQSMKTDSNMVWSRTYNFNDPYSIIQTTDGGYLVKALYSSNNPDTVVFKLNNSGEIQWSRKYTYDTSNYYSCFGNAIQTTFGDYVHISSSLAKFIVSKINNQENNFKKIWLFDNDSFIYIDYTSCNVVPDPDGGFAVAGGIATHTVGTLDWYNYFAVVKFDSAGNFVWRNGLTKGAEKTESSNVFGRYIWRVQGGYIAAGWCTSTYVSCIVKFNENGSIAWHKNEVVPGGLIETSDGGFVTAANISSQLRFYKYDSSANCLWYKSYISLYSNPPNIFFPHIAKTSDGNYILGATTSAYGAGGADVVLIKVDPNGNPIWQKTYGGNGDEILRDLSATDDGGLIVAAKQGSFGSNAVWILKLDANGNMTPDCSFIQNISVTPIAYSGYTTNPTSTTPASISLWIGSNSNAPSLVTGSQSLTCGCIPDSPTNFNAQSGGPNQILLSWDAVPEAVSYRLYRKYYYCNTEVQEIIADNITATNYLDATVQGGVNYFYMVTAIETNGCESDKTGWLSASTTGECLLLPCFNGIAFIRNNSSNHCKFDIIWNQGNSSCPNYSNLTYTVYRSLLPDFVPDSSNIIATCLTGTSFTDANIIPGERYYYIVRTEDSRTGGNGPCNGGNLDQNLIRKNRSLDDTINIAFFDDLESGLGNWTRLYWDLNSDKKHSGSYSVKSLAASSISCDKLTLWNPIILPQGALSYTMSFWTQHQSTDIEAAGIVEISNDNSTWTKLSLVPPYPSSSSSYSPSCLGTNPQPAFTGNNSQWTQYQADISAYVAQPLQIRFNYASKDNPPPPNLPGINWWIDDISISYTVDTSQCNGPCTNSPSFDGLQSAQSTGNTACQITLSWNSASSNCSSGTNITYHIYRSTDPDFNPMSYNRIASCVTGTSFSDMNVLYGTTYYYIVRAEDSTNYGNGPCNNGNADINVVKKNATPASAAAGLNDDFEHGLSKWDFSGNWNWSAIAAHSGTYSAHSGNVSNQCDTISLKTALTIPSASSPSMTFWTYYRTQDGYDGGIVEVSSDEISWTKLYPVPNYPSITGLTGACIGVHQYCFSGNATDWMQHTVDLTSYENSSMKVRFRYGSDDSINVRGWFIDDVNIQWTQSCTTISVAPGAVPDNDNYPGMPLLITKTSTQLHLAWNPPGGSCLTDDYALYRGSLPWSGYNHTFFQCSTNGMTEASIDPGDESYYYLIVAQSSGEEGIYGLTSDNTPVSPALNPCVPQHIGTCN